MQEVKITIWSHDGTLQESATVPGDLKVSGLRSEIQERWNIPQDVPYYLMLKATGQRLDDQATVQIAGIPEGADLVLVPLPKGG